MVRKCPHCGVRHPAKTQRCPTTGRAIAGSAEMVGQLIAERYHLVRLLGDGGMGSVYKAADKTLRRFVAIKLLHTSVAQKPASVERFEREARAAASIGHPNIIDIIDFGRAGQRPYMVMEYLRGRSLSHVIATEGRLDIKRACTIAIHTLAGLQAAHDRHILHRDLKPANLMLVARFGDRNFVKICDFGFAALYAPERFDAKSLTPERTLVGTPAYAAPERLRGDDRRDPRMDVYSIGVVLYEMLVGRRPFDAPTFRELARKVRKAPPPPLRKRRPEIPRGLEKVVLRALAKPREERWANAEAFAQALYPFGGVRLPFGDDEPSDSFTMEMMRIKALDTRHRTSTGLHARGAKIGQPVGIVDRRSPRAQPAAPFRDGAGSPVKQERETDRPLAAQSARPRAHPPATDFDADDQTQQMSRADAIALVKQLDLTSERASTPPGPKPPVSRGEPPPEGARVYSGRMALGVLRFVSRRFGERSLQELLASMPESVRTPFVEGIGEDRWVAMDAVHSLMEHIDARFGEDDLHLILEAGRAAAEGAFDLIEQLQLSNPPAELLIAEMPTIFDRVLQGSKCEVKRVGRGYGRLEFEEMGEASLTFAVGMLGFVERSLQRFGANDVEVNLLSCRALGDAHTLIDLSWFA